MRNYKKYRSFILTLFADYLAGKVSEEDIIFDLQEIERELSNERSTSKYLWFRFSYDDNLVTNITDIENGSYYKNRNNWINEQMQTAIDNPKGFQIYYS